MWQQSRSRQPPQKRELEQIKRLKKRTRRQRQKEACQPRPFQTRLFNKKISAVKKKRDEIPKKIKIPMQKINIFVVHASRLQPSRPAERVAILKMFFFSIQHFYCARPTRRPGWQTSTNFFFSSTNKYFFLSQPPSPNKEIACTPTFLRCMPKVVGIIVTIFCPFFEMIQRVRRSRVSEGQ